MDPARPEDETEAASPGRRPHRRSHTTSSDVARYAGLFAQRTTVMRSSAMRDLMEITVAARGDLAGRRASPTPRPSRRSRSPRR